MIKTNYSFTPNKLIKVTKKIKETFPTKKELEDRKKEKANAVDFEELIKRIERTKFNKINYLAEELNKYEVIALANNYSKIPDNIYNKANKILQRKYNKFIIETLWKNFIEDFNNSNLISLLVSIFKVKFPSNDLDKLLKTIFSDEKPLKNILSYIVTNNLSFNEFMDEINILIENKLTQKLAKSYFYSCSKDMFKKESDELLKDLFIKLKKEDLAKIVQNYLLEFETDEFKKEFMYKFEDRFGDPIEDYNTAWYKIDKRAKDKAISWYNRHKLKEFFDRIKTNTVEAKKRFEYWEGYIDEIINVKYIEKNLQLFLIFNNFVVVEFGNLGNAVYFYKKDYFNEKLAVHMNPDNAVSNNLLKHTSEARDKYNDKVFKVNHHSNWEYKVDRVIRELKSGRR